MPYSSCTGNWKPDLNIPDIMNSINTDNYFENPDGLILPRSCLKERPIAIDLFSGCGGFSLGLVQAGYNVIAALDNDLPAIHSYLTNLGAFPLKMVFIEESDEERTEKYCHKNLMKILKIQEDAFTTSGIHEAIGGVSGSNRQNLNDSSIGWNFEGVKYMFIGDVRKITGKQILETIGLKKGEVDLVVGGPPCQGFTAANTKRSVDDPRNDLVFEFIRLVLEIRPETMVMENVPGILNMTTAEGLPVVDTLCHILEKGDYGEYERLRKAILSTAGCGWAIKGKPKKTKTSKKKKRKKNEKV